MVVYVGVRFEHTLGASRSLVGSDAAHCGRAAPLVCRRWRSLHVQEWQRPHSISTLADETEIQPQFRKLMCIRLPNR